MAFGVESPAEATKKAKVKKALDHIDSMTNHGDRLDKANTKELLSAKDSYKSYIETSMAEAERLATSKEIDEIRKEIKGGLEKPKTQEEKDQQWEEDHAS